MATNSQSEMRGPKHVSRYSSNVINEARLQRCQDILKNSEQSDRELNSMMTGLQIFQEDALRLGPNFSKQRTEFRSWIREAYITFDKEAWWWFTRLDTEAKLLRIGVDYDRVLAPLIAKCTRCRDAAGRPAQNLESNSVVTAESPFCRRTLRSLVSELSHEHRNGSPLLSCGDSPPV